MAAMKETLQNRYIRALLNRGHERVANNSKKYVKLGAADGEGMSQPYYFVGAAGSLRKGCIYTASIPVAESVKNKLLEEVADLGAIKQALEGK